MQLNYARRRKPIKAGELKSCLWDSFVEHRTEQEAGGAVAATQQDTLSPVAPPDTCLLYTSPSPRD